MQKPEKKEEKKTKQTKLSRSREINHQIQILPKLTPFNNHLLTGHMLGQI